jgi:uncharacterized membrane protein YgdD (TMEM256/DUF423 family)
MQKQTIILGASFAITAVIIGAFGAHYLKTVFTSEQLLSFEIGVRYQMYHAIALIITAILFEKLNATLLKYASYLFSLGILLFSGSIYALNILKTNGIMGLKGLGITTPIGGVLFILGWLCIIIATVTTKQKQ